MPKPDIAAITLRPARPDEAGRLSKIALTSKAAWDYDDAFMAACIGPLTVTPEEIAAWIFAVAEGPDGAVRGFHAVSIAGEEASLEYMFALPQYMGTGLGKRLMLDALDQCKQAGCRVLLVESDVNAVEFYQAMGGVRIGDAESTAVAGRMLPLLSFEID